MTLKNRQPSYIGAHSALRGIASVTVLLSHAKGFGFISSVGILHHFVQVFAWADISVFLFFILSGFVMSHVYVTPVGWKHFFSARLARLVPVYEVTLLFALGVFVFDVGLRHVNVPNLFANLTLIQQWFPVRNWYSINTPSWSLSVEAFLYLFAFPLLVFSRTLRWKQPLYFVLILMGAIWGTIYYNYVEEAGSDHPWGLSLASGLAGFSTGFALQSLRGNGLRYPTIAAAIGISLISFSLAYCVAFPLERTRGLLVLGLILIVACSTDPASVCGRVLIRRSLLFLGDISYSLYLWHFPIFTLVIITRVYLDTKLHNRLEILIVHNLLALVAVSAAFAAATASYYKLEVPFRRLIRDRFIRAHAGAPLPPS